MNWTIARATMQGTAHQATNTKCQDYIGQIPDDGFACITVADGVGAAKYSNEGAQYVTRESKDFLWSRRESLFELDDEEIKHLVLQNLNEKLGRKAQELGCETDDLASTLMFFFSNGEQFIAGNLGDGLIGYKDEKDNFHVLLDQERGKYANVSYFVTSNNSSSHLRIVRGIFCTSHVYFLMTDGSVDCLYNRRTQVFAKAMHVYCGFMNKYDFRLINSALETSMYRLFPHKTTDDCALALIVGNAS